MKAKVDVDNDADFAKWMETGGDEWNASHTPGGVGQDHVRAEGCNSCHTVDGTKSKGPSWKGIWGKMVKLNNGTRSWWMRPTSGNR